MFSWFTLLAVETNTTLQSNYTPIKNFLKRKTKLKKKKDKNTTSGPEDEFNHCPGYDPKATFHLAPPLPSRSVGAVLPTQEPGGMCAYNVI